jgi:hypothetical protein
MPIEIRELVIKATVSESGAADRKPPNGKVADAKEAEMNLIVEKILEILKQKSER